MNMQTEPIRLPLWVASLLSAVVIPFAVALLTDVQLKTALATALLAVVPLLGAGEVARSKAWSPASHGEHLDHLVTITGASPDLPYDDVPSTRDRGAVAWGTVALVVIAAVALFIWLGIEPPR